MLILLLNSISYSSSSSSGNHTSAKESLPPLCTRCINYYFINYNIHTNNDCSFNQQYKSEPVFTAKEVKVNEDE